MFLCTDTTIEETTDTNERPSCELLMASPSNAPSRPRFSCGVYSGERTTIVAVLNLVRASIERMDSKQDAEGAMLHHVVRLHSYGRTHPVGRSGGVALGMNRLG